MRKIPSIRSMVQGQFALLAGITIVLALAGCDRDKSTSRAQTQGDDGSAATTSGQKAAPIAAAPVADSQVVLPEFYGLYALDEGKLTPLKEGTSRPVYSRKVEFIAYDKSVAFGIHLKVYRLPKPKPKPQTDGQFHGWGDWMQKNQANAAEFDAAMSGIPRGGVLVEMLTKPVKGQQEMLRVIPATQLVPGEYQVGTSVRFDVEIEVYRKQAVDAAQQSLEAKKYQKAIEGAQTAILLNHDASVRQSMTKVMYSAGLGLARQSMENGRWIEAENAASMTATLDGANAGGIRSLKAENAFRCAEAAVRHGDWDEAMRAASVSMSLGNPEGPAGRSADFRYKNPIDIPLDVVRNHRAVQNTNNVQLAVKLLVKSRDPRAADAFTAAISGKYHNKVTESGVSSGAYSWFAWGLAELGAKTSVPVLIEALSNIVTTEPESQDAVKAFLASLTALEGDSKWKSLVFYDPNRRSPEFDYTLSDVRILKDGNLGGGGKNPLAMDSPAAWKVQILGQKLGPAPLLGEPQSGLDYRQSPRYIRIPSSSRAEIVWGIQNVHSKNDVGEVTLVLRSTNNPGQPWLVEDVKDASVNKAAYLPDQNPAALLFERALKAHGGEKLAQVKACIEKYEVHYKDAQGAQQARTGEITVASPTQFKLVSYRPGGHTLTLQMNNQDCTRSIDGKAGVIAANERLADIAYANRWCPCMFVPLRDRRYVAWPGAESRVGAQTLITVNVYDQEMQKMMLLWFDKDTGLVARRRMQIPNAAGANVLCDIIYSDYKELDGITVPMRLSVTTDGKPEADVNVREIKFLNTIDDSAFK